MTFEEMGRRLHAERKLATTLLAPGGPVAVLGPMGLIPEGPDVVQYSAINYRVQAESHIHGFGGPVTLPGLSGHG